MFGIKNVILALIPLFVGLLVIYFIVKLAVKNALNEYFEKNKGQLSFVFRAETRSAVKTALEEYAEENKEK